MLPTVKITDVFVSPATDGRRALCALTVNGNGPFYVVNDGGDDPLLRQVAFRLNDESGASHRLVDLRSKKDRPVNLPIAPGQKVVECDGVPYARAEALPSRLSPGQVAWLPPRRELKLVGTGSGGLYVAVTVSYWDGVPPARKLYAGSEYDLALISAQDEWKFDTLPGDSSSTSQELEATTDVGMPMLLDAVATEVGPPLRLRHVLVWWPSGLAGYPMPLQSLPVRHFRFHPTEGGIRLTGATNA